MRVLVQRVTRASVTLVSEASVSEASVGESIASIGQGLLVFVGVFPDDGDAQIKWLADKVLGLRIFPDADSNEDTMNASLQDIGGELLVVSQFTLAADTSRGRRPGFSSAAAPEVARLRYDEFVAAVSDRGVRVATGRFGANMQVDLSNDGPVTFLLEK